MSGVALVVDLIDLPAVEALVTRLERFDAADLLTDIAAIGEMQTRRRIEEEKTAPDGTVWKPNRAGTPILLRTGEHLRDSIASSATATSAEWGSSWEYAHVHEDGAVIRPRYGQALKFWFVTDGATAFVTAKQVTIPRRPFVGLSAENGREIEAICTDHLGRLVR